MGYTKNKLLFVIFMILPLFFYSICLAGGIELLWEKNFSEGIDSEGKVYLTPVIEDVTGDSTPEVIVGVFNNIGIDKIFVLNGRDSGIILQRKVGSGMFLSAICVVSDMSEDCNKITVGGFGGVGYILNAADGDLLKKIDHGKKVWEMASSDIDSDGITDYALSSSLCIDIHDGKTGKKLWGIKSDDESFVGGFIDDINEDGFQELIGTYNRNMIVAIDAVTGENRWVTDLGKIRYLGFFSGPNCATAFGIIEIDNKKRLVVGTAHGDLFMLDGKTGRKLKEKKEITGFPVSISTGNLTRKKSSNIVLSSTDHKVYCLNGENLEKLWEYKTGDEVYSSPALGDMDNDGLLDVVVVSDDSKAYCIDGKDGELIWKYQIGSKCGNGQAMLGDINSDGFMDVVIRGTVNGNLIVLKTGARCKPGQIDWPKIHGNNRNTGEYGVE